MRRGALFLLACVAGGAVSGAQETTPPAATQNQPADAAAATALAAAEAKLDAKDYGAAKALLLPYLSAHPADARALFDMGYLDDAQDQAEAAAAAYRKAIAADPQQFEARLALGLLLARRNEAEADPKAHAALETEARQQLETALRLTPNPPNPPAEAQAGRALARLLRSSAPEAARQALLGALKLSPQTPDDTLLTAQIAEAAGDPETAAEAYRATLAATPGSGDSPVSREATAGLAHLLVEDKHYAEAESLLRKSLAAQPGDPVLTTALAAVLAAEDQTDQAIGLLETLHTGRPDDRAITRMLADLYTAHGEPAKADPLYAQLLGSPGAPAAQDAALLAARGDNLVRQKRFAEAVAVLQQAVQLDPQDGNAWSSLAFAASVNHQPQLTLDALTGRSKVMSETPATYFLRATSYDSLHETKRAVDMYKQFLAVAGGRFPDEEWQAKHRLAALPR